MSQSAAELLKRIFGHGFAGMNASSFAARFFAHLLSLADLAQIHDWLAVQRWQGIDAATLIPRKSSGDEVPFLLLAQVHGNEPAGLAGALLALALAEAGLLEKPLVAAIGNPVAAEQYFAAWRADPAAPEHARDIYRAGVDAAGHLLRDMNRIPDHFREADPADPYFRRAQALDRLARSVWGVLDIHSARGELVCVTDHGRDEDLLYSPIRAVLDNLIGAIAGQTGSRTLKRVYLEHTNVKTSTGIEAGRHEDPASFDRAAHFTLAHLFNLGITPARPPGMEQEDGRFIRYRVEKSLTYAALLPAGAAPVPGDLFYPVLACQPSMPLPPGTEQVLLRTQEGALALAHASARPSSAFAYAVHQYGELEPVRQGQVLAVSIPSGVELLAPADFCCLFVSKSAARYRDPAVGPWPVPADKLAATKFCYPATPGEMGVKMWRYGDEKMSN